MRFSIKKQLMAITLVGLTPFALANYSLNLDSSSVNFLSTKNVDVTESHSFDRFSGNIDDAGKLALQIDLSSVNTLIPIRNERMQSMLFNVTDFSTASFEGDVDPALLALSPGQSASTRVDGKLTISGTTKDAGFDVVVTALSDGKLSASTVKPTLINASDFGLDGGVEALREIAMLQNISKTVPLSFYVVFDKQ